MQIAAELGIQPSMLRQWRTTLMGGLPPPRLVGSPGDAPASPVASPSDQAAEIARLRRELDRTRIGQDVEVTEREHHDIDRQRWRAVVEHHHVQIDASAREDAVEEGADVGRLVAGGDQDGHPRRPARLGRRAVEAEVEQGHPCPEPRQEKAQKGQERHERPVPRSDRWSASWRSPRSIERPRCHRP